jgi:hypothetical protein
VEPGINAMPVFKNTRIGTILECEDGFIAENEAYDKNGIRIEQFEDYGGGNHLSGFIEAVRSNRPDKVACPVQDGHLSAALCHLGNISHRIGQTASPEKIAERIKDEPLVVEAWQRCCKNLKINQVDLAQKQAVLGAYLSFDDVAEKITGAFADTANPLLKQPCRNAWSVPEIT